MSTITPESAAIAIGSFEGWIYPDYDDAVIRESLGSLPQSLEDAQLISARQDHIWRLAVKRPDGDLELIVKRFGGRRSIIKAQRTWRYACALHHAGGLTPEPVACLYRHEANRSSDAFFISINQTDTISLAEALSALYADEPYTERFIGLMQAVAPVIRRMHDAGFQHRDLGNQNILLRRTGTNSWDTVKIIDLNRGRLMPVLSDRQRGRDLSRISLPSDFMRVFIHMYWGDTPPPQELIRAERSNRACYRLHHRSRIWRHPIREYRRRCAGDTAGHRYPLPRDMWVWDERSAQALTVMQSKDRLKHYPLHRHLTAAWATARACPSVWLQYRRTLKAAYSQPIDMHNRIGISLEPDPTRWPREQPLLSALSPVPLPVLIRFYHHEGDKSAAFRADVVRSLHAAGHPVDIALVQDRRAVRDPHAWCQYIQSVLETTASCIRSVEVTHAMNRVKWGIWDFSEFKRLMEPIGELAQRYPDIDFIGPAIIDFEYMYVLGALSSLPPSVHLGALSHLLYVDRRGAPESRQGRFSTLEKAALARAIATWSPHVEDRLIISEVNWPLDGTGVYSPVGAPYVTPGVRTNDPSVDELTYAAYMVRYLLITICSGLVDRVYWWRLAAHGFGLVDDQTGEQEWRKRPAYQALQTLLHAIGQSHFTEYAEWPTSEPTAPAQGYWFKQPNGTHSCIAWTPFGEATLPAIPGATLHDMLGRDITPPNAVHQLTLTPHPVMITCA